MTRSDPKSSDCGDHMKLDRLMTVGEVCARLSVGRTYIYQQIQAGTLKVVKLGRMTRFSERDLAEWLAGVADAPEHQLLYREKVDE